ncbi:MAG: SAM hydrolase/SAM-dependent halogenase family protein [Desulforhopalus sp.]
MRQNPDMQRPVITLITDFGQADEYVGVVKGVILSHNSHIQTVDISHRIPPQDIVAAAHLLARSFPYFPPATVHLVIVDPGVGSTRPLLAITAGDQYFIGPDNGVFTPIFDHYSSLSVYRVEEADLFLHPVSNTFHGRDIMAPVAARLASGFAIEKVGTEIDSKECTRTANIAPVYSEEKLYGQVTHVDSFGNLTTNISRADIKRFGGGEKISVHIGNTAIASISDSYAHGTRGTVVALIDSQGFLEIAVNMGSGAQSLGVSTGTPVILRSSEA